MHSPIRCKKSRMWPVLLLALATLCQLALSTTSTHTLTLIDASRCSPLACTGSVEDKLLFGRHVRAVVHVPEPLPGTPSLLPMAVLVHRDPTYESFEHLSQAVASRGMVAVSVSPVDAVFSVGDGHVHLDVLFVVRELLAKATEDAAWLLFGRLSGRFAVWGSGEAADVALDMLAHEDVVAGAQLASVAALSPRSDSASVPLAVRAMNASIPLLVVAGTQDCISAPAESVSLYTHAASECKAFVLANQLGCLNADAPSPECVFEEQECADGTIADTTSSTEQLATVGPALGMFLQSSLLSNSTAWDAMVDFLQTRETSDLLTFAQDCYPEAPPGAVYVKGLKR